MRVLVTYGRRRPYPPFGEHLVKAFRSSGHQAELLCVRDWPWWARFQKQLPRPWKMRWWDHADWANRLLLGAVERYRPDLILETQGDLFTAATLQAIKRRWGTRLGASLVEGPFSGEPFPILAEYDRIVTTSVAQVQQLRRGGFRQAEYLPFATDPDWFHPARDGERAQRHAVGFIGAYSPRRAELLEGVTDLRPSLWGPDWDRQGSSPALRAALRHRQGVFGRGLVRCYQTTKIFVNIQREQMTALSPSGQRVGTGLGWRHFDVPACGSLLLSEWVMELPEAFVVGEEIETFSSPEELRGKARHLLAHEERRLSMARRARARVLREHTYLQRVRKWIAWYERLSAPVNVGV